MQFESTALKTELFQLKQDALRYIDKPLKNKVKGVIEARIFIIDHLLMWLNKSEKEGELNMADLKLGELTTWEAKPKESSIDAKIIHDAQNLKKNGMAVKVTVNTINWTTFNNRTYVLRQKGQIDQHIVPRKDDSGNAYLVYLDHIPPRRSKVKV